MRRPAFAFTVMLLALLAGCGGGARTPVPVTTVVNAPPREVGLAAHAAAASAAIGRWLEHPFGGDSGNRALRGRAGARARLAAAYADRETTYALKDARLTPRLRALVDPLVLLLRRLRALRTALRGVRAPAAQIDAADQLARAIRQTAAAAGLPADASAPSPSEMAAKLKLARRRRAKHRRAAARRPRAPIA